MDSRVIDSDRRQQNGLENTPRDEDGRLGGVEVNHTEAVGFFYAEEVIEVRLLKGSS